MQALMVYSQESVPESACLTNTPVILGQVVENALGKELTKSKGTEMAFSLEHKPAIMCMFINDT